MERQNDTTCWMNTWMRAHVVSLHLCVCLWLRRDEMRYRQLSVLWWCCIRDNNDVVLLLKAYLNEGERMEKYKCGEIFGGKKCPNVTQWQFSLKWALTIRVGNLLIRPQEKLDDLSWKNMCICVWSLPKGVGKYWRIGYWQKPSVMHPCKEAVY